MVLYNSELLYKNETIIYEAMKNFFEIHGNKQPTSMLTSDAPHVINSIKKLQEIDKMTFHHYVAWSYKLKSLKAELKRKQYSIS